jgi:hypothetical protein
VFGVDESEHWASALRCAAARGIDSRFPKVCAHRFGLFGDLHRIQKPQSEAIELKIDGQLIWRDTSKEAFSRKLLSV